MEGCKGCRATPSLDIMSLSSSDARLIREHIARIRKGKFTQSELSEALGKGQKYVGRVETGEIDTPPLDTLAEISSRLGYPLSYIFFTDGFGETAEEIREKLQEIISTDDIAKLRRYYRLLLVAGD